jgi:hypothetical protein
MGFCVVRQPADGGDLQGYAGIAGWPLAARVTGEREAASLRRLAGSLQRRLEYIRARITAIEKGGD